MELLLWPWWLHPRVQAAIESGQRWAVQSHALEQPVTIYASGVVGSNLGFI